MGELRLEHFARSLRDPNKAFEYSPFGASSIRPLLRCSLLELPRCSQRILEAHIRRRYPVVAGNSVLNNYVHIAHFLIGILTKLHYLSHLKHRIARV